MSFNQEKRVALVFGPLKAALLEGEGISIIVAFPENLDSVAHVGDQLSFGELGSPGGVDLLFTIGGQVL